MCFAWRSGRKCLALPGGPPFFQLICTFALAFDRICFPTRTYIHTHIHTCRCLCYVHILLAGHAFQHPWFLHPRNMAGMHVCPQAGMGVNIYTHGSRRRRPSQYIYLHITLYAPMQVSKAYHTDRVEQHMPLDIIWESEYS